MLAKVRTRLRPPTAYEAIALALAFLALGGSTYAATALTGRDIRNGSLSGRDVRNGSLTGGDVRNRSLLAHDFKAGQLPAGARGATGTRGPIGPRGATGAAGAAGASGATRVVVRTESTTLAPAGPVSGDFGASCNAGERATGGGARFFDDHGVPVHEIGDDIASTGPVTRGDMPVTAGDTPGGWDVFFDTANADGRTFVVYAVCASTG